MSLIADALKAAQRDRGQADAGGRNSRRLIAASVLSRGGTARGAFAGTPFRLPRSLGLASALFGCALVAGVGVVAVSPTRPPRPQVAAASLIAPLPLPATTVSPPDREGSATDSSVLALALPTGPALPASLSRPPVPAAAPSGPPSPAAQHHQVVASEPAPERMTTAPSGRFRITVEPTVASVDALLSDALAAHRRGDVGTAISLYERSVVLAPRNGAAWRNLGTAYQGDGQTAPARDAFRRALEVSPRDAAAWSSLGAVLGALGQIQEAEAALGEAIRLDPSDSGARVNLANHYLARGLTVDARRLLEEVVRDVPTHPEAHYALGRLLETQGDRAGAVHHYRSFLENGRGRFPQQDTLVRRRIEQLGGA